MDVQQCCNDLRWRRRGVLRQHRVSGVNELFWEIRVGEMQSPAGMKAKSGHLTFGRISKYDEAEASFFWSLVRSWPQQGMLSPLMALILFPGHGKIVLVDAQCLDEVKCWRQTPLLVYWLGR